MSFTLTGRIVLADETGQTLSQIQSNVDRTFRGIGDSAEEAQRRVSVSTMDLVKGISGVATSAFALYQAWDRVADMQVSVDRANLQVKTSLNALEDAQRRYNASLEKYGADSDQARAALADLRLAQERYQVAVERAEMVQGNLNEVMVSSALSVIPTMITMVSSLATLKQSWTVITGALTAAQHALNAAMAANPIGIVIVAVTALVGALIAAYNACEPFRNAINAIGAAIYNYVKPAFDAIIGALRWLWDLLTNNPIANFIKGLLGMSDTASQTAEGISQVSQATVEATQSMAALTAETVNYVAAAEAAAQGEEAISREIQLHALSLEDLTLMSSVASQANYELADATLTHIQASSAAVQVEQAEAKAIAVTTQAIKAKTAARRELSESEWRAYEQEHLIGKTAEEIEAYEREHGVVTPVWEETTTSPKFKTYAEAQQAYLEGALKQIQMKGYTAIQAIQLGLITGIQAVQLNLIKIEELVDYLRKKGGMSGELLVEEGYLTREQAIQYGFIKAQEGFSGIVSKPTLFLAGEKGPERVYIGPTGSCVTSNITVTGPLVVIQGSADRDMVELAAELVEKRLRAVLVEASSTSAPAVSKRIRLGTVLTGV